MFVISRCMHAGTMDLPVSQLTQPPRESQLLREADPTFVRNLKLKMRQDPSAPGSTPTAVLCKNVDVVTEFNIKHKNVYKYEVLGGGGLHTLAAKNPSIHSIHFTCAPWVNNFLKKMRMCKVVLYKPWIERIKQKSMIICTFLVTTF